MPQAAWIFALANALTLGALGVLALPLWIVITALLLLVVLCWQQGRVDWLVAAVTAIAVTVSAWMHMLQHQVRAQHCQQRWRVVGNIVALHSRASGVVKFDFEVKRASVPVRLPLRLRAYWFYPHKKLHVGETWQLTMNVKPNHGLQNPGGPDPQRQFFRSRVHGRASVVRKADNCLLKPAPWLSLSGWRQYLVEKIAAPRLAALLVGKQELLSSDDWRILQATGTSHLLAISGLHVGMVSGFVYWLAAFIWQRLAVLQRCLIRPVFASALSFSVAALYAALAGFAVPTQRALALLAGFFLMLLSRRNTSSLTLLSIVLLLVLLYDPFALLSVSTWLSFLAVCTLIVFMPMQRHTSTWCTALRTQVVVTAALMPVVLLFFQQVAAYSLLANSIAIPVVTFVIVPVGLLGILALPSTTLSQALFNVADFCLRQLFYGLNSIAALPGALWHTVVWPLPILFFLSVGIVLLLLPRGFPGRRQAWCFFVPILLYQPLRPAPGEAWMTVLDVGQGLAVVIETAKHTLLYDAGPKYPGSFDAGARVLVPYLRGRGVRRLDKAIISHGDNDHSGGLASVASTFPIKTILSSEPKRLSVPSQMCQAGQHWQWDGIEFAILAPQANAQLRGNNASCVLRVRGNGQVFLLPGDIEAVAEQALLQQQGAALAAQVLIAPHHGSKTSSSQAFIVQVHPREVIYAVGYRNRFHFPAPTVARAYNRLTAQQWSTAKQGAIRCYMKRASLPAAHPCKPLSQSQS